MGVRTTMSMFLLVPGAGGVAWYWHRVVARLRAAGHEAVAVELPGADAAAGLPEYADLVTRAADAQGEVIIVAQSLGAFAALPACSWLPVRRLVLNNAMIPLPGERPGQWWENTGWEAARVAAAREHGYAEAFDVETYLLHDVPSAVAAAGAEHQRPEADIAFEQACDSRSGQTCRRRSSRAAATGSSRSRFSAAWRTSASAWRWRRCRAGT
jgi:hypothetical protein